MKKLIFVFLAFLWFGCKKDDGITVIQPPAPPVVVDSNVCQLGLIRLVENGDTVINHIDSIYYAYHDFYKDSTFTVGLYRALQPFVLQDFRIYRIPFAEGKLNLYPHAHLDPRPIVYTAITVDQDQGAGWYIPDSTQVNTLEVVKIDREKQTIQGRFQATLVSEKPPEFSFLKDTLHITDGVFHVNYRKWE